MRQNAQVLDETRNMSHALRMWMSTTIKDVVAHHAHDASKPKQPNVQVLVGLRATMRTPPSLPAAYRPTKKLIGGIPRSVVLLAKSSHGRVSEATIHLVSIGQHVSPFRG